MVEGVHLTSLLFCQRRRSFSGGESYNMKYGKVFHSGFGVSFDCPFAVREKSHVVRVLGEDVVFTPDLMCFECVVEVKTRSSLRGTPFLHHCLQLILYLGLSNRRLGFLVYFSPRRSRIYMFTNRVGRREAEGIVGLLLRNRDRAKWGWECGGCGGCGGDVVEGFEAYVRKLVGMCGGDVDGEED